MLQGNDRTLSPFAIALEELTRIQRDAAKWDEGSILVLAGPGSGKTRVLTCRIARLLLENDAKKFRVLGLTFTNKAADEMRDRVMKLVPGSADRLFLGTFHSFCAEILRQHGTHLGFKPDFRIYSNDEDRAELLKDAIRNVGTEQSAYPDINLLAIIDRMKADLIGPDECENHVLDQFQRERVRAAYQAYEHQLRISNALDFNSLIFYTCQLFEKFPAFAKRYKTVYPYWCIDEFQDTNLAQYKLLKLMAQPDFKNIFVVADDDQVIYQWNGASHRRIEDFQKDFAPAIIQLPTNHRCPAEIVDLANNLIAHNSLRHAGKKPLKAARPHSMPPNNIVRLLSFDSQEQEAENVASDISIHHGKQFSQVVVLGRNRRLLEGVSKQLRSKQIKSFIAQRRDEFLSAQFIWLHCVLRQSNDRRDSRNFETLCESFSFFTQIPIDAAVIIASAKSKHGDYLREWAEVIKTVAHDDSLRRLAVELNNRLIQSTDYRGFVRFAIPWLDSSVPSNDGEDQFNTALDYQDDKRAWTDIFQQITSGLGNDSPLETFLHELELRSKEPPPAKDAVTLMTIHGSKGKEFDHVYLIGLAEDILPSFQSKKKGEASAELEEERRNCFVALTRAIKTVTMTYASVYYGWTKEPSRFLKEMGLIH